MAGKNLMKLNIKIACNFCNLNSLVEIYDVPESTRDTVVMVCDACGLVQSKQTKEKPKKRKISTSSGADWGNIRHSKSLRLNLAQNILNQFLVWKNITNVLDIGSSRGDFVKWIHKDHPRMKITALEPDSTIVDSYKSLPIKLHIKKYEDVNLPLCSFDLVYLCHTLEHVEYASHLLKTVHSIIRDGGFLYLEVPNIQVIMDPDIVEEFFIDKHTFHFSPEPLLTFLEILNFKLIHQTINSTNISLLLQKSKTKRQLFFKKNSGIILSTKHMIAQYVTTLRKNRGKLKNIAEKLYEFMGKQRVVFWGGGRIFDALVRYGGLKTDRLAGIIDQYLSKLVPEVHGIKLQGPELLRLSPPDVVVILAKSSADEIEQEVRRYGVRHVIKFKDLITDN